MRAVGSSKRAIIGAGLLALPLLACIPDDPPAAPPKAPVAADQAPAGDATQPGSEGDLEKAAPSELLKTVESMKSRLNGKDRDFNINSALGNLYYDNGRYIDGIEYFTDALKQSAPVETRLLDGHNIKTGGVPESCQLDKPRPEDIAHNQKQRSFDGVVKATAGMTESDALACLRQLVPTIANVHARRGNSWYLVGNADKARVEHSLALALDENNPEALFFSGAAALETAHGDPAKLAEGRAFWERLVKTSPTHPRAELVRQTLPRIDELFGAKAQQGPMAGPGPLPAGAKEMAANFQHTSENEAELDKITLAAEELLKQGKWSDARTQFLRVMPVRPSGRIALGMGIALRELGKPNAEMVLKQAAIMPGGDPPRARYELAVFYEKTNPGEAKALYTAVQDDPKVGAEARARLAKLP
jgi:tetratricopeptide (TPR) repeat protein